MITELKNETNSVANTTADEDIKRSKSAFKRYTIRKNNCFCSRRCPCGYDGCDIQTTNSVIHVEIWLTTIQRKIIKKFNSEFKNQNFIEKIKLNYFWYKNLQNFKNKIVDNELHSNLR